MKTLFTMTVLCVCMCVCQAVALTVTNVTASQIDGRPKVQIGYELINTGGLHGVSVSVSTNSGASFILCDESHVTGDVGQGISPGENKEIVWDAGADMGTNMFCGTTRMRVRANDVNVPWIRN